ncbi:Solute carrier organic anion transporter family member 3A1-like protein [Dinothrombium tinctorium]|uniref:Solute carrier organic anion transporter family member n=1 Tax=Dinothrombium tinctorium TaxID=1965070 RepID=A0A3S3QDE8_9ACAR|nr:Solute carrier organic anion transporter family member 3A1-like protein [Dinothrombium tinctorium]
MPNSSYVRNVEPSSRRTHRRFIPQFSDPRSFLTVFTVIGNLELALYFYLISVLNTLEKRFGYSARTTAVILICDNIASAVFGLLFGHWGCRYNRPHLMGVGVIIISLSALIFTMPYFIFGPGLHLLAKSLTTLNQTTFDMCDERKELTLADCRDEQHLSSTIIAIFLFCLASLVNGIGYSSYYVLGVPYLDDNVEKEKFPVYIGISVALRFVGPVVGYGLGSICLLFYENPFYNVQIQRSDPRFIGAWWPGFILLSLLLFLSSIPLFFFPRRIKLYPRKGSFLNPQAIDPRKFGNIWPRTKRMLANTPLILKTIGGTVSILSMGYILFMPKYFQIHFRQTSSEASFYSGLLNLFPMGFGTFFGGFLISKYKPSPKLLLVSMFLIGILQNQGLIINMFLKCPQSPIQKNVDSLIVEGHYLTTSCNSDCNCNQRIFQPICASDRVTELFSPCHAGCSRIDRSQKPELFYECKCLGDSSAVSGLCSIDCSSSFSMFLFVCFVYGIISSFLTAGDTVVAMRCMNPDEKTYAVGFMHSVFSLFAWLPFPLIYGAISDSSCMVWGEECNQKSNCWIYDVNKYRFSLHSVTYFFGIFAAFCNLGVLCFVKRLNNFYNDNDDEESGEKQDLEFKFARRQSAESAHLSELDL